MITQKVRQLNQSSVEKAHKLRDAVVDTLSVGLGARPKIQTLAEGHPCSYVLIWERRFGLELRVFPDGDVFKTVFVLQPTFLNMFILRRRRSIEIGSAMLSPSALLQYWSKIEALPPESPPWF